MWPLERILGENGTQLVFEHRVFEGHARQCGETDAGADGMCDRDRHRSEAKYDSRRGFDIAVRACKGPRLSIADHDAVVIGEIPGRLRSTTTLQIFLRGRDYERHRSQGTSDKPGRKLIGSGA